MQRGHNGKTRRQPNRRDSKRGARSGTRSDHPQRAGLEPWSRGGGVCRHLSHVFPDLSFLRIQHAKGNADLSARINVSEISISKTVGRGGGGKPPRETDSLPAPGGAK